MAPCWSSRTRQNPDEWGRTRVYPPSSGVPGARNPDLTPYAIPFGRAVAQRTRMVTVMVTAAQSGKTETFLDIIGERLDNRPAPILYVGPSREFNTDQFEPRLRELFEQSKSLGSKIIGGLDGKAQKKTLKRVAGVTLRLGTARSPTSLKSSPAGMALVDEYDEMLANLRDQGDVWGLIEARGETYADFSAGITSTPSQGLVECAVDEASGLEFWLPAHEDNVTSPIWRLWQSGTRHHWCWPCPHCGEYFVPRRKQLRYPKDATPVEALRSSWLECPRCAGDIQEHHKAASNARGEFVAPGETISRDGRKSGAPPDVSIWSLWVSGLCSPFKTFGARAQRYLAAVESGESAKIQTAVNAAFGEVALPAGADTPNWEEVRATKALGLKRGEIHPDIVALVAAADVHRKSIYYVVRGFGARSTSWLVDFGELHGLTKDTAVWDELGDLLSTPIGGLPIKIAFVDSGFRPGEKADLPLNRVYEFCRRWSRFVYPVKGSSHPMQRPLVESAIEVAEYDGSPRKFGLRQLRSDTDHWKATVHERLSLGADAPGCLHLNAEVDEDYCRQIVAEMRVGGTGGAFAWIPLQGDNHYLDCEAMAAAAAYRIGAHNFGPQAAAKGAARRQERMVQRTVHIVAPANLAPSRPIAPPRRSTGMGGWARRFNS